MKTNFHNKNFALSLAFIMRFQATRKWSIERFGCKSTSLLWYSDLRNILNNLVPRASPISVPWSQERQRETRVRLVPRDGKRRDLPNERWSHMEVRLYSNQTESSINRTYIERLSSIRFGNQTQNLEQWKALKL